MFSKTGLAKLPSTAYPVKRRVRRELAGIAAWAMSAQERNQTKMMDRIAEAFLLKKSESCQSANNSQRGTTCPSPDRIPPDQGVAAPAPAHQACPRDCAAGRLRATG